MEINLSENQLRTLAGIFEKGAAEAASALSRWLGGEVRLSVSSVEYVPLEQASEVLGAGDELVAACAMTLAAAMTGQIILVFEDRSGLALVDLLLRRPVGTTSSWGELEQSAAKETANIVGCAYLNSLAEHLPPLGSDSSEQTIVPGPPEFRHEFAASLLEFALMDQALANDRLLLINTEFSLDQSRLDWTLLLIPSAESLHALTAAVQGIEPN